MERDPFSGTTNPYSDMTLEDLKREREYLRGANSSYSARQKRVQQLLAHVSEAMKTALVSEDQIVVTDHAIVRWLERIEGMDLDPIRDEIKKMIIGRTCPIYEQDIISSERAHIVVRDGLRVVTVLSDNEVLPAQGEYKVVHPK